MSLVKKIRGNEQWKDESKSSSKSTINQLPNEVLDMMFQNLGCNDLMACRLVSLRWSDMSTYKLLSRKCLRVDFPFKQIVVLRSRNAQIKLANNPKANSHSLEHLSQILLSVPPTKSFPTSRFYFIVLPQNENEIIKFFTSHGNFIKDLELNLLGFKENTFKTVMLLQKLLVEIPNVENLVLNIPDVIRGNSHELSLSRNGLEKLKTLKFGQYWLDQTPSQSTSRIIRGIVENAKNIEALFLSNSPGLFDLKHIPILSPANKSHIIKKIYFKPDLNDDHEFYQQLLFDSTCSWGMKHLVLELPIIIITSDVSTATQRSKISHSVENILNKCSAAGLEELKIIGSFLFLKLNKLPRFPHLSSLTINVNTLLRIFPTRFDLNWTFPNLQSLCLEIDVSGAMDWTNIYSETRTSHNNLKELVIKGNNLSSSFNENWIENIGQSFPRLRKLDIGSVVLSKSFGNSLWNNFSMLKSLHVEIIVDNPETAVLDSIFSGISRRVCEMLRRKRERDLTDEDLVLMKRENPSILNLKNLVNLEIGLCGESVSDSSSRGFPVPVLSYVTGKFAFARNKNLKPRVYFPGQNLSSQNDFTLAWSSMDKYATVDFGSAF